MSVFQKFDFRALKIVRHSERFEDRTLHFIPVYTKRWHFGIILTMKGKCFFGLYGQIWYRPYIIKHDIDKATFTNIQLGESKTNKEIYQEDQ